MKDLYEYITPQYAADWKVIGTLLGIAKGEMKIIEAAYPINVKWCCNQMLEKWLEQDTTASWKKLLDIIESPAVSCEKMIETDITTSGKKLFLEPSSLSSGKIFVFTSLGSEVSLETLAVTNKGRVSL